MAKAEKSNKLDKLEQLRQKHLELTKESGSKGNNNPDLYLKVNDGTTVIRILPSKDDSDPFYAETKIHRVRMPDKEYENNVHCRRINGEDCPLCTLYLALWKTKVKDDEKMARAIKPRERFFINVIDRESDKVKIFSLGSKLFTKIVSTMLDADFGDITDLKDGHDYKVIKSIVEGYPNYDQSQARPKSEPAGTDKQISEYMGSLHDIKACIDVKSYDDVKVIAEAITPSHLRDRGRNEDSGDSEPSSDAAFKKARV